MGKYVFKLPDVGEGTAEAEVVGWHIKVGDMVEEDQIIADIMTDKATVEITSPVSGKVISTHGEPGEMAAVGSPLVVFEVEGAGNAAADFEAMPTPAAPVDAEVAELGRPDGPRETVPAAEEALAPEPDAMGPGNYIFKLPDVGEGTAEAELVGWHVKVGDHVAEDQLLADVMTDKATVELTSPVSGKVVALHGEPGGQLAVGSPLVALEVEGKGNVETTRTAAPAPAPAAAAAPKAETKPASVAAKPAAATPARASAPRGEAFATRAEGMKPLASPAVRQRARDLGIELQFVPGSGPAGRIGHDDLDAYVQSGGRGVARSGGGGGSARVARPHVEDIKIIGMRRKTAEKMQEAKRRIPHFMYAEEIDVTELEALRAHLNAQNKGTDRPKLNLLPFLATAMIRTLPQHRSINGRFDDDNGVFHQFEGVHLGIAAQTPTGLMVPVVRHAEALDIYGLADEIARLGAAAKAGKATKDELSGSTITITSLGTLGGLVHTPVINHPEVAIVGPNKIIDRVVVRHGQMVVRKMMNLSSSFDHRIVDGYDAAEFIQKVKGLLEHPATLFMD
ncbi:MAG: 2-oxo acid dehydrogenase subunit E2 [Caulobacteraceae bacterium]|nr:2-oxo acid dehydrogenase subunit E2 [Caulobacteraceae bacterium]